MGLHLCYELALPRQTSIGDVEGRMTALHTATCDLPLDSVSDVVRWSEVDLDQPRPLRGLAFVRLEDVVHHAARFVGESLYAELNGERPCEEGGPSPGGWPPRPVPTGIGVTVIGFAVSPGRGAEPAAFALQRLHGPGDGSRWWWHYCCKTQYASVVGEEHLIRCHGALVTLLDRARALGLDLEVRDQTGYWLSRDARELVRRVGDMNRVIAGFGGMVSDAVRDAGADSGQVSGAIFQHPDFERLESDAKREP